MSMPALPSSTPPTPAAWESESQLAGWSVFLPRQELPLLPSPPPLSPPYAEPVKTAVHTDNSTACVSPIAAKDIGLELSALVHCPFGPPPRQFLKNRVQVPFPFFWALLKIEDDPIFTNNSYCSQAPVEVQLAITLFRFGHDGNAASVDSMAQWAGVSAGLVVKST
ncbi:hypothetical protein B0H19DRAFT_1264800 [Mycena capillaripes]|nr:hypothetical protein B0H19DRAFT_1264800 [Mycena capillaripes]